MKVPDLKDIHTNPDHLWEVALIEFERGHGGWMEGVIEGIEGRLKKVEEEG